MASTTLEQIYSDGEIEQCDLLKIDCEGAEYEILFGASSELLDRTRRMALEYHNVGSGPQQTGEALEPTEM